MLVQGEFPHTITLMEYEKTSDGGGGFTYLWKAKFTAQGFLDTPSSQEVFEAQQLNNPLDRNLFYPYRRDIHEKMRCVYEKDGIVEIYELVGRPLDQGGQEEKMLVPLKLVKNG